MTGDSLRRFVTVTRYLTTLGAASLTYWPNRLHRLDILHVASAEARAIAVLGWP
jgi:hypothetical protein